MSKHTQLWCSLSIVAVLLLSACQLQVAEKSAAGRQHELQVACLAGGRVWDGSKCGDLAPPSPEDTATPTTIPTAKPLSPTEIIDRSRAYVVRIDPATGCASGVMLGKDGLIITNHHVVAGQGLLFATADNGTIAPLRVLFSDPSSDLALVQAITTLPEPEPIVWGDDTRLDLGTQIFVLGYPLCSDSVTVTSGIYSVRTSFRGHPLLQTDAALNPGVSGGLAITSEGRPVGIAVAGLMDREMVGFLIPANVVKAQVKRWLDEIEAGRSTSSASTTVATGARVRYTVVPNDSFTKIASRYGITVAQLATFNDLCRFDVIRPGQVLMIPGASYDPPPKACPTVTPRSAPTPTPRPVTREELKLSRTSRVAWTIAYNEFHRLEDEATREYVRLWATLGDSAFLGEWEDALEAYREGAYKFVREGNLPRFSEVREINDRMSDFVEARLRQKELYIRSLKAGNRELYGESDALLIKNSNERRAIWYMMKDLRKQWGL